MLCKEVTSLAISGSEKATSRAANIADLPPELLVLIAEQVWYDNCKNNLLLPRTCRSVCCVLLPWLYEQDIYETLEDDKRCLEPFLSPPYSLVWACRHGSLRAVEAALGAIDELRRVPGVDKTWVLEDCFRCRPLPKCNAIKNSMVSRLGEYPMSMQLSMAIYDHDRGPLMHIACSRGHSTIMELLMKHGANLNSCDNRGNSLFGYCMNSDMVHFLISNGLDVNTSDERHGSSALASLVDWKAYYAYLHWFYLPGHVHAAQGGDGAVDPSHQVHDISSSIQAILELAGTDLWSNTRPIVGHHPLEWAIRYRHPDVVRSLLDAGFSPNLEPGPEQLPQVLLSRAMSGTYINYDIIHMLLDAGAEVEHPRVHAFEPLQQMNCSGWLHPRDPSLAWAAKQDLEVARRVCERSTTVNRLNMRPSDSLIVIYANQRRTDIMQLLIKHGARRTWGLGGPGDVLRDGGLIL